MAKTSEVDLVLRELENQLIVIDAAITMLKTAKASARKPAMQMKKSS